MGKVGREKFKGWEANPSLYFQGTRVSDKEFAGSIRLRILGLWKDRFFSASGRFLNLLFYLFLMVALMMGYFQFKSKISHLKFHTLEKISLGKNSDFTLVEIQNIFGIYPGKSLFQIDLFALKSRADHHFLVESSRFEFKSFNELEITLFKKKPVLLLLNDSRFYEVGSDGTVLDYAVKVGDRELPILNGLYIDGLKPGAQIHHPKIVEKIDWIKNCPQKIRDQVSDFNFDRKGRFFLYTMDGYMVYPGSLENFASRFELLKELLNHFKLSGEPVKYLDMRFTDDFVVKGYNQG